MEIDKMNILKINILSILTLAILVSCSGEKEPDLARCDSVGILGTATGMTGLIVAQKTINFFLEKKYIDLKEKYMVYI